MNPISALYVDDESDLLDLTRLYLEQDGGITIETCISAAEAITLLATRKFDVVISDYQMPEMNGIVFLKYIREHYGHLPFILFTGRGREDVVIQALENGADFYLQKGGDPTAQFAELRSKIEKAVGEYRAVSAREDAERRLFDIINFLPDATFAIDREGTVILWNHAMEDLTGVPAGQMLGKGNYEYALPLYDKRRPLLIDLIFSSPEEIREKYSHIVRTGTTLAADTTTARLRGKPRILWGKASPLYDPQGAVAGAIEVIRDITDRQKIEEALRESEEKFREMADMMPQIIFEADTTGRLTYANAIAFNWTGYTPEEFARGIRVAEMFAPEDRERGIGAMGEILAGKEAPAEGQEYLALRRDGSTFPVTIYAVPILRNGLVVGMRGIIIDISGRKKADEKTRERERVLTTLISNLPGVVYRCTNDREWTMAYISAGCLDLTGYAPEEILGNRKVAYNDIIHPDYREQVWLKWQAALDKKQMFEDEYPIITKSGETRWVWERGQGIFSDDGRLLFLEGFLTDVTRRRTVEEVLEKKSRYYELLLRTSTDAIYVLDKNGSVVECNDAFLSHLGYTAGDRERLTVADWNAEWDPVQLRANIAKLIRDGGRFETIHRRKDGSLRHVEIKATPVIIEGEERLYASARDITKRKNAEEALKRANEALEFRVEERTRELSAANQSLQTEIAERGRLVVVLQESEDKFRNLVEKSPVGVYLIQDGLFRYVNAKLAEIFGYSVEEITGRLGPKDLIIPEDRPALEKNMQDRLSGTVVSLRYEMSGITKTQKLLHIEIYGSRTQFQGRPAILGSVLDITDRKNAEKELQSLYSEMEQRVVERTRELSLAREAYRQANTKLNLLNSITRHDISNQLTALKGFLAISKKCPGNTGRIAGFIEKEERIADVLERQITFTRYYQDMGVKEPAWQNVETTIRRGAALLPLGRVTLQVDRGDLEVYADPLFEKVFYNLIDNALRYGGEGLSAIRVYSVETGDGLLLTFEDDGAGINDDDRKHLFERGFGKNTGFGLFLAREILGITGISIWETGIYGTGARFGMLVPKGAYRFVHP